MTFDEYEQQSKKTAIYPGSGSPEGFLYVTLGLCGESGEVAEKVKKLIRGGELEKLASNLELKESVAKELGDILWYIAASSRELGFPLSRIARMNLDKLEDRQQREVLHGEGDSR
jgi:NTP pyrophosphatase (non-canonical NTP hydrolase)